MSVTLGYGREANFNQIPCGGAWWLVRCDCVVRWQDLEFSDCGVRLPGHYTPCTACEETFAILCFSGSLFGEVCLSTILESPGW